MNCICYRLPVSISSPCHCLPLYWLYDGRQSYRFFSRRFATCTPVLRCHAFPTKFPPSPMARPSEGKASINGSKQHLPPWFSVAPMMDWTDNHYRTLARLISQHAWLYTEMIVAETIVHQQTNLDRFLEFPETQHPIVLQIGGSNLANLAKAAELANAYGYDEINLNCGCPSGKVAGHGCFGAQLMFNPKLVGEAMAAIAVNSDVPVSVKCRIGVDDHDTYDQLSYGVMIGRAAYNIPWSTLGHVDAAIYGMPSRELSRRLIFQQYQKYADSVLGKYGSNKPSVRHLAKPLLHMFHSEPGAGLWKRRMDEALRHCTSIQSLLEETLEVIPNSVLDASPPVETSDDEPFPGIDMLLPEPSPISSCREVVENLQCTY